MLKHISAKNINYTINEKSILRDTSFKCTANEKMCIFGENGAGKSTLLKILCGQITPDSGFVQKEGHVRFAYVTQEFDPSYNQKTIEEYIKSNGGDSIFKKIFSISDEIGFNIEKNLSKHCSALSGGQQKILSLSTAFASSPDFILLDEPENHLDIVSRMALISIMSEFSGGMIFISHDRLVVDSVSTKVGELADGKLHISEGGYEDYIQAKMERIGGLQRQFDAEKKRIRKLSSSIVILQQKALRGKEISAYRRAKEELDNLKQDHKESGRPDDKKTKIKISTNEKSFHNGKLLWKMKDGAFKYPAAKNFIFKDIDLKIRSGNKIVLIGRNGSGKSTFLKCLTKNLSLEIGEVEWIDGVSWSYFDQHAEFDPSKTPIEIVSDQLGCIETDAQAALGAMRFDLTRMKIPSGQLSGGERMRIRFAITFGKKPDTIILDEPTNHIDEVTWEILLDACKNTKSSILLVTHDYEFIQEFDPSFFWMIKNHKIEVRHKDLDTLLEEMKTG